MGADKPHTGWRSPLSGRGPAVSIQVYLLGLLVLELSLAMGLTWYLWYRNGRDAVADVQSQIADELSARIHQQILQLVDGPEIIGRLNASAWERGQVDLGDIAASEARLWDQLETFPSVSYVQYATEEGDFLGVERGEDGSLKLELMNDATDRVRRTWAVTEDGERSLIGTRDDYVVTARPWYRAAAEAGRPAWSPIYTYLTQPPRIAITLSWPFLGTDGRVLGVHGADLILTSIDGFLRDLEVGERGRAFLVERDGMLVGSSSPVPAVSDEGGEARRVSVFDVEDDLIRGTAEAFRGRFGDLRTLERAELLLEVDGVRVLVRTMPIRDRLGLDWVAFVAVPEVEFLGDGLRRTRTTLLLFLTLVMLVSLAAVRITHLISAPFVYLSEQLANIRNFQLDNDFSIPSNIREVRRMSEELTSMQAGLVSFTRFVPANLVRQLVRVGEVARIGGEERKVTVLFADLVSYSTIVEHLSPVEVVEMLNEYLGEMQEVVEQHDGCVLEILGDAMLVVFGAPGDAEEHSELGVRCAIDMRDRLVTLNDQWETSGLARMWQDRGIDRLRVRIGVHSGPVVAGNMGSRSRLKYGIVGDTVNVAARLEDHNRRLGTEILFSDTVMDALPVDLSAIAEDRGVVALRGRTTAQRVFSL